MRDDARSRRSSRTARSSGPALLRAGVVDETVRTSRTLVSMAYPSMNSSRIGMNSVKNSVCGSRRMCRNSLWATDQTRQERAETWARFVASRWVAKPLRPRGTSGLRSRERRRLRACSPPRQRHEHVFQIRLRRDRTPGVSGPRTSSPHRRQGVDRLAEDRRLADRRAVPQSSSSPAMSGPMISSRRVPAGVTSGSCFSSFGVPRRALPDRGSRPARTARPRPCSAWSRTA